LFTLVSKNIYFSQAILKNIGLISSFCCISPNAPPAAASAGFTWLMFSLTLSFLGLMNAYLLKPPVLLAAGLLAADFNF